MFKKAERKRVYLKIGLMGPSGAGKSYSALKLAKGLAEDGPIAAIDTENGSLSLYADVTEFDVVEVTPPFHTKKAVEAIKAAESNGYKVLVIDSQTHFWKQILEDKEALDRNGGNQYTNWGKVKPKYEELKEAILHCQMHVICCLRAKDEYVIEKNSQGRDAPRKVGMGAIAEPGAEFEYTTVFEIGMDHSASASKDRTGMFDGEVEKISEDTGKRFLEWLEGGSGEITVLAPVAPAPPKVEIVSAQEKDAGTFLKSIGFNKDEFVAFKTANPEWVTVALEAKTKGLKKEDLLPKEALAA